MKARNKKGALRPAIIAIGALFLLLGAMPAPAIAEEMPPWGYAGPEWYMVPEKTPAGPGDPGYVRTPDWEGTNRPGVLNDCSGQSKEHDIYTPACRYHIMGQKVTWGSWAAVESPLAACTAKGEITNTRTKTYTSSTTIRTTQGHSVGVDTKTSLFGLFDLGFKYEYRWETGKDTMTGEMTAASVGYKWDVPYGWIGQPVFRPKVVRSFGWIEVKYAHPVYDKTHWQYPAVGGQSVITDTYLKNSMGNVEGQWDLQLTPCRNKPFQVKSEDSGKCLAANTDTNTPEIRTCDRTKLKQRWVFTPEMWMRNQADGRCLHGSLTSLARLIPCSWIGASNTTSTDLQPANVRFRYVSWDKTIRHMGTGKCLDVEGGVDADGTRVVTWKCGAQLNQRWTLNVL